jgi:hypothetical protein
MVFVLVCLLLGASSCSNRSVPELSFGQIKPRIPALGLFPSAVVHAAFFAFLLYPPLFNSLNPPRIIERRWENISPAPHDSFVMTKLNYSAKWALVAAGAATPPARKSSGASSRQGKANVLESNAGHEEITAVQPTYSGPREVVSLLPNSTNSVQTILRPDLVNPPTREFPQLLKPVVILPSIVSATLDVHAAIPIVVPPNAMPIKSTVGELPLAKIGHTAPLPAVETQARPLPEIESASSASSSLAVIVLNAVTVPDNAPMVVPQAQLSGSFAVRAIRSTQSGGGASALAGSTASSDETKKPNQVAQGGKEMAVDPPSEIPTGNSADQLTATGKNLAGSSASSSSPNRSGPVTGNLQGGDIAAPGQAAQGAPGITIIGGTSRGGSRVGVGATTAPTYGLTVISSGTSGGASRDLGVFERSETVYTVYIPMADAGGGPDWPIQYAILAPLQTGSGLLTPPVAVKKVRAVLAGDSPNASTAIIFFSGVISANGELTVKPLRNMDARAHQALDALYHWEFRPAQLNGIAVGIKVLIGVATVSH